MGAFGNKKDSTGRSASPTFLKKYLPHRICKSTEIRFAKAEEKKENTLFEMKSMVLPNTEIHAPCGFRARDPHGSHCQMLPKGSCFTNLTSTNCTWGLFLFWKYHDLSKEHQFPIISRYNEKILIFNANITIHSTYWQNWKCHKRISTKNGKCLKKKRS